MKIEIEKIKNHPKNDEIYGSVKNEDNETFNDLKLSIKNDGLKHPIILNRKYEILSGHRRYLACKELEMNEVECEFKTFETKEDELRFILIENKYRVKTRLQLIREAELLKEIEEKEAKLRMKRKGKSIFAAQNFAQQTGTSGHFDAQQTPTSGHFDERNRSTNEIVGDKFGMSRETLRKGFDVSNRIKEEPDENIRFLFGDIINNESVDSAYRLSKKSNEFIKKVKDIKDNTNKIPTSKIIDKVEKEEYYDKIKNSIDKTERKDMYLNSLDDLNPNSIDLLIYSGSDYDFLNNIIPKLKKDSLIYLIMNNFNSIGKLRIIKDNIKIKGQIVNILKNMKSFNDASKYNNKHNIIFYCKKRDGIDKPLNNFSVNVYFETDKPSGLYEWFIENSTIEGQNILDIEGNENIQQACINTKRNYIFLKNKN